MTTKEGLQGRSQRRQAVLLRTTVIRTAEWGIRFVLGAVLAGAEILGGAAPFGLGFVAASGSGVGGFSALLGVCFGYICFQGLTEGLRYLAAAILIFSLSFAFYDLRIYRKGWFLPAAAGLFCACTGFVYLAAGQWSGKMTIIFFSEIALTAGAAYFYRIAFSSWDERGESVPLTMPQLVSCLILGGSVLIALNQLVLPGGVSLGRMVACAAVLIAAYAGGAGYGSAAGIAAGVAMDLAAGGFPYYGMAYAAAGLMAGVFWRQGRLFCAISYVLANAVAVLWTWDTGMHLSLLYEVFVGSVIFFILPEALLRRAGRLLVREGGHGGADELARAGFVRARLAGSAEAFRELYRSIRPALRESPNDGDGYVLFERAAGRVCRDCALREACWQRDYQATHDALGHALPAVLDQGRCTAADFPDHFRSRCIKLGAFLKAANEELAALLTRRQYRSRIQESRRAVCRQYEELADILGVAAAELSAELTPDNGKTKRLRQYLTAQNLDGEVTVFYDESQHLRAEMEGSGLSVLAEAAQEEKLSALLGVPLRAPEVSQTSKGTRIVLTQAEPLMALAGLAARRRGGEMVSGDAGTWFKHDDGTLYVLLCDGMGSGPEAHAESALAVRLLEKFLQAGVVPETALRTLNSALALRDEAAGGFSTVDLLGISLYTGEGAVYKYGAAPTYLKKGGAITKLSGSSLPAGLIAGDGVGPDVVRFRVAPGDCVVMVTDGVTAGGDDDLRQKLTAFDGASPKDLACALVAGEPAQPAEAADDSTVIVLRIKHR